MTSWIKSVSGESKSFLKGSATGAGVVLLAAASFFGLRYIFRYKKQCERIMEEIKRREESKNPVVDMRWNVLFQAGEIGTDGKMTDGFLICKNTAPNDGDEKYCLMRVDSAKGSTREIIGSGDTLDGAISLYVIKSGNR